MNWNSLFFLVFPYFMIFLFVFGTLYRFRQHPFTISSLSSELLERRKLYWGSLAWHWSIVLILGSHLLNFLLPSGMEAFEKLRIGLFMAQILGSGLGILAIFGLGVLLWRRSSEPRVQAVTTLMDLAVLTLLLIQCSLGTGIRVGLFDAYASWFPQYFVPYFISLFTFSPQPELLAGLPWLAQAHVFNALLLLAVLPFSRLIHLITLPLGYLVRPWQTVVWMRRNRQQL